MFISNDMTEEIKTQLIDGEYYRINKTNKILYWDGENWLKPIKDQQKRYCTWNSYLENNQRI